MAFSLPGRNAVQARSESSPLLLNLGVDNKNRWVIEILIEVSLPFWQANILHCDPVDRYACRSVGTQGQRDTRPRLPGALKCLEWGVKLEITPWPWEKRALYTKA